MSGNPADQQLPAQLSDLANQFLQKLTGGAFEQLGGMAADWLRQKRFELAVDRIEGTAEKCREAGFNNPEEVSLSVLVPWLENASIEDNPDLHEMWESLLANSGDPRNSRKPTHRSFVRILKQIEGPERKVLEALYQLDEPESRSGSSRFLRYPNNDEIREAVEDVGYQVEISESRLNLAKINLVRLGLCSKQQRTRRLELKDDPSPGRRVRRDSDSAVKNAARDLSIRSRHGIGRGEVPEPAESQEGPPRIHINDFGRTFFEACQPPSPTEDSGPENEIPNRKA